MKNYIIKQKVSDLTMFQRAFDRLRPKRAEAGLTDLGQFCAAEERDTVIVVLEVVMYLAPKLTGIRTCLRKVA